MEKRLSLGELLKRYPNDKACLREIVNIRWPDGIPCPVCKIITPHYQLKTTPAFSCKVCKHHIYPCNGTIFEKSRTPLKLWFYAMFIMTKTRSGVSAKALQRELGVTYKTAWRIWKQIRMLMLDDNVKLTGVVEVDETWVGGKDYFRGKKWWANWHEIPKQIVMGMVERGGRVKTVLIRDTDG